jgi:hypothetical protein
MSLQPALELFLERLPWLAELGPERLNGIDRSEWYLPSTAALALVRPLLEEWGVNLMFYDRDIEGVQGGLCTMIVAADLSASRMEQLAKIEATHPDCLVVAYERPLRRTVDAPAPETLKVRLPD